jgi:hypothetical protein
MEGRQRDAQADVPRPATEEIRPGRWGQWATIGVVGFVGFVVLALLLVFGTVISQLDQRLLAAVISLRTPELTVFASTATRLGSTPMVVYLGLAAAVVLWFRSRSIGAAGLVTILKIALDSAATTGRLGGWRAAVGRCFSLCSHH